MYRKLLSILLMMFVAFVFVACEIDPDPDPDPPDVGEDCTTLPAVDDYGDTGPFSDVEMFENVGPSSNYTLFRPTDTLGTNGFKHPILAWGNGIATTPRNYQVLLTKIASHGFVIIGCNDLQVERDCMEDGLEWLIDQNTANGDLKGMLDTSRELIVGYSWGGGAAIDVSDRPNVKATVSMHGMPPRTTGAFRQMHDPLLLFTSTGDSFVSAALYVTPNYNSSTVQTFYATLEDNSIGHLYPIDNQGAELEQGPTIGWLRYWGCDDDGARDLFFGTNCETCVSPWSAQRKNWSN